MHDCDVVDDDDDDDDDDDGVDDDDDDVDDDDDDDIWFFIYYHVWYMMMIVAHIIKVKHATIRAQGISGRWVASRGPIFDAFVMALLHYFQLSTEQVRCGGKQPAVGGKQRSCVEKVSNEANDILIPHSQLLWIYRKLLQKDPASRAPFCLFGP